MLQQLSRDEFLELSKRGNRIAVFREISSDLMTPISVFQALSQPQDGSAMLESAEKDPSQGRFSFLGIHPIFQFVSKGEKDAFDRLRECLKKYRCVASSHLPPLAGGAIGFIAYDAIRLMEEIPDRHVKGTELPDLFFQFYEVMIAFDHMKGKVTFSIAVDVGANPSEDYERGMQRIDQLIAKASTSKAPSSPPICSSTEIIPDMDDVAFCKMVEEGQKYIVKGDAFQIVLSRRFQKKVKAPAFDIYRALRFISPAPFMFFIETKDFAIAGASPERLVKLHEGKVETMPIAGTRPRAQGEKDRLLEQELLQDEKEVAEHMMLVDLGRNDIGRISEHGTVQVKELKAVHRFSHVMHIVSKVEGTLKKGLDALDVIQAVFPAGTLSGAPKIRAMEIIDELENSRRELYGGAVCSIDSLGNLDSCIAIRTVVIRDGLATVRAGGGIVLDSHPQTEANESAYKAKGVLEAIKWVEEGKL